MRNMRKLWLRSSKFRRTQNKLRGGKAGGGGEEEWGKEGQGDKL